MDKTTQALVARVERLRDSFLLLSFVLATISIIGNALHINAWRNITPWGTDIKINPALCLLLTSIGCRALIKGKTMAAQMCAILVSVLALLTMAEWLFSIDLRIDQLLLPELTVREQEHPGRMPMNAALSFAVMSSSLFAQSLGKLRIGQLLGAISFAISLLAVIGHAYGLPVLTKLWSSTIIALPMAVCEMLLGFALVILFPTGGSARLLTSNSYGGLLARTVLPIALAFPILGFMTGIGRTYPEDVIILSLFNALFVPIAIWIAATKVDRLAQDKDAAFDAMKQARRTAEEALESKRRFLSTVSHEVRTPMAGVMGMVELLDVSCEGESKTISALALDSCNRLLHILNELLEASSLQSGSVKLEHRFFPVRSLLGDTAQLIREEAAKKHLQVSSRLDPRVPEFVCGDELRVRQLLMHLLFNAVKFTNEGQVTLSLELLGRDDHTTKLKFSVEDTGIGITESEQQKLFEPFSQVADPTTQVRGGAGMGLSICKNIIELMGGEIGVSSKLSEGSVFWLIISFNDESQTSE